MGASPRQLQHFFDHWQATHALPSGETSQTMKSVSYDCVSSADRIAAEGWLPFETLLARRLSPAGGAFHPLIRFACALEMVMWESRLRHCRTAVPSPDTARRKPRPAGMSPACWPALRTVGGCELAGRVDHGSIAAGGRGAALAGHAAANARRVIVCFDTTGRGGPAALLANQQFYRAAHGDRQPGRSHCRKRSCPASGKGKGRP